MKTVKTILGVLVLGVVLTTVSCKDAKKEDTIKTEETVKTEKLGKEHTSAYVCPMHCKGSGSDKEGNCPTCKMAYVKNENTPTKTNETIKTEKLGKEHTSAYVCPMHCKGSGSDKEGNCPTCKMTYVKNENYKAN